MYFLLRKAIMDQSKEIENMIEKYKMNSLESKAYKVCLIWIEKSRKIFPNYNHTKLRSGDPRKSILFKVCYKFVRETEYYFDESNHGLYVQAQLDILKHINIGKEHPLIDVNCLVGEKAWKRWKLWKKKYDTVSQIKKQNTEIKVNKSKIYEALKKTREFIRLNIGESPSVEKYAELEKNRQLYRWINFGKISPYYIVLSPYIKKIVSHEELKKLHFDLDIYKAGVDDSIIKCFKDFFSYEF